jgi:SulP family sulfate permease
MSAIDVLDASGARALREIVEELTDRGVAVLVKGASPEHRRLLEAVGALAAVAAHGHVFDTLAEAVDHAAAHVAGTCTRPAPAASPA